jgi:two-component system OmpR family sensor kinase
MARLRARLFAALAVLVVLTALAAGGLAYRWAYAEAIELQDSILVQMGELALKTRLRAEIPAPGDVDAEARIVVEEIGEPGPARLGGGLARHSPRSSERPSDAFARWRDMGHPGAHPLGRKSRGDRAADRGAR